MPAETHMLGEPVSRDEVFAEICERIAELLDAPEGSVTAATRFGADLGADDAALIDVVTAIEEEFGERNVGIALDDEQILELATVGELFEVLAPSLGVEDGA
jgi:acyl carrier protein